MLKKLQDNIKNNLVVFTVSIMALGFFAGYSIGIESEQGTYQLEQKIKKLEEKINDLGDSEITSFKISKGDDPMLGNPNAPVSIIEFSDYQCPFCARFYAQTLPLLKAEYINTGDVNFIYRDYPIKNHHNAMTAAIASECADEQGKFWQYHDALFKNQDMWKELELDVTIKEYKQFASELGLDQNAFDSCLDSEKYFDEVNLDMADGKNYKVSGTPTFFIGNEESGYSSVFGAKSFSEFQTIIDEKLSQ